jgi:hypothetical protein
VWRLFKSARDLFDGSDVVRGFIAVDDFIVNEFTSASVT